MKDYRVKATGLFILFFICGFISMIFFFSRESINKDYSSVDCIIYSYELIDGGKNCLPRQGCSPNYIDELHVYVNKKNRTINVISKGLDQPYVNKDFKEVYKGLPKNDTCYHQYSTDEYYGMFIHLNTKYSMISMIIFGGLCISLLLYISIAFLAYRNYEAIN